MNLNQLLENMWNDYCVFNPSAQRIHDAFVAKDENVINDHIALRTLNHPRLGIQSLANQFESYGYRPIKDYVFTEKKLKAWHYEHTENEDLPKIFISELELEKMSPYVQTTMSQLAEQVSDDDLQRPDLAMLGRPWTLDHETYLNLAKESEYASWVAAYGFRPNHFTVNVNALKNFRNLEEINGFVKSLGYTINSSGGEIKGSPEDLLEQSSTMAEESQVKFSDGTFPVPACYYEFALRYKLPSGKYYQGFVAASADKIFESTNRAKL